MSDFTRRFEEVEAERVQVSREALAVTRRLFKQQRRQRQRRLLIKLLCSVLLCLFTLEAAARLIFPATPVGDLDPVYGWALKPNTAYAIYNPDTNQPIRYRTNAHGWKDVAHTYTKPPGVFRLVIVGDSNTWGVVEPGQEYHRQLERLLHEAGYPQVEVIALGVGAWGTDQILTAYQREGVRYDPDLVVYQWDVNDLWENTEPTSTLPHDRIWQAKPFRYQLRDGILIYTPLTSRLERPLFQSRFGVLLGRVLTDNDAWWAGQWAANTFPREYYQWGNERKNWRLWAALVHTMQPDLVFSTEGDVGKRLFYGQWYDTNGVDWSVINLQAQAYLGNIPLIPPTRPYTRYDNDIHANAEGNLAMAQDLMEYLIENGWLPS